MTVLVDSVVPAGCLFRASHAGRVLLGEVVACDAASGRWEASLQVYCKSGEERAAHAGGPVSVLPELLALNAHLSEACACNPEPRGVRIPRS